MASFGYEREHAPGRQPGAGPLEHRRREAGELWTALSLEPDASRGEPAVVRDGYFRPPAAFPVPSVGETEEEPPAEEPPEEEQAAAAGVPAAAPKSLRPTKTTHSKSAAWAYETRLGYEVLDDKGTPIKGFDVNEKWTTAIVNDDPKTDWRRGAEGSLTSGGTTFDDLIGGEAPGHKPTPLAPGSPLGSTKVQHWGQDWYVGSLTPGKGTKVQSDTLQKYQDHGAHESIKSPP